MKKPPPPVIPQEWITKAPRLKAIAKWINENTTLVAEIEKGFCNTDRKIPGSRLITPGKGRHGNRLKIYECADHRTELDRNPWHYFNRTDSTTSTERTLPRSALASSLGGRSSTTTPQRPTA